MVRCCTGYQGAAGMGDAVKGTESEVGAKGTRRSVPALQSGPSVPVPVPVPGWATRIEARWRVPWYRYSLEAAGDGTGTGYEVTQHWRMQAQETS